MARQKMLLQEQRIQLVRNHRTNLEHRLADGKTEDFPPVVKLFNPCGSQTWLLSELDPETNDAFGLCDIGQGTPELGYVSLDELAAIRLRFGMYIERDIHFIAKKTICEYAAEAKGLGRIELC